MRDYRSFYSTAKSRTAAIRASASCPLRSRSGLVGQYPWPAQACGGGIYCGFGGVDGQTGAECGYVGFWASA